MEYVDIMTTLQPHIKFYQDTDEGFLPPSLGMLELATCIDKSAKAWVSQYGLPCAHRMYGGEARTNAIDVLWSSQIQVSPHWLFALRLVGEICVVQHSGAINRQAIFRLGTDGIPRSHPEVDMLGLTTTIKNMTPL